MAALVIGSLTVLPSAQADQVSNEDQLSNDRAYAQQLTREIASLGLREAALGEKYDAGVVALHQADAHVAATAKALASAKLNQSKTIVVLRQDALQAYVGGGPVSQLAGPVALSTVNQALLRQELEQSVASHETTALDNFQFAAAQESTAHANYVLARSAARQHLKVLERDRVQVQAAQNKLVGVQQQVKGQIGSLVAEIQREERLAAIRAEDARLARERAAREAAAAQAAAAAAARAAAQRAAQEVAAQQQAEEQRQEEQQQQAAAAAAQQAASARQAADVQASPPAETPVTSLSTATTVPVTSWSTATTLPVTTTTALPASPVAVGASSVGAAAVAAAETRLGDPYVWGAAGPDEFDCSGLVMWAYEQVGVDLPHYSGAQFADTTQIPMSDLEPGDLVFPADPGEHVAMYIGNGEVIQAPYTGADVQIIPLSSFFVLATRVG